MRKRVTRLLGLFLFLMPVAAMGALEDCADATCRITNGNTMGTGVCYARSPGLVWVLTNAHVVSGARTVECEFWSDGHLSRKLHGAVVATRKTAGCDAAIVSIPERAFQGRVPKVIPLAAKGTRLAKYQTICSMGCPGGTWATGWKGHALSDDGTTVTFTPPPKGGRSGSALFNAQCTEIVGLVYAREGSDRYGIAVSVDALDRNLTVAYQASNHYQMAQCGPEGCFPNRDGNRGGRLFPWRNQKPEQGPEAPEGAGPYPTLPPEAPLPPEQPQCPAVDLDPLANKLDKIAELIEGLNKKQEAEPQKPLQDDVARDMATKAVGATAKLAEALDKTDKKIDTVDAKVNVIDEEAGKLKGILQESGNLRARMALRMDKVESELGEDASKLDKVRAYMKDYVGEKVTSIKERDASTRIMIWIALGAILFLFWDVRQKQKTGDPLAIEKMLGHLSDRLETSQIGVLRGMGALADRLDERLDSVGAGDTEVDKKDTSVKGFSEGTPAK